MVRLGVRSLLLHELRSTLSMLGVVFGVAAVVAMASVGEGARRESLAQVESLGIDTVTLKARAKDEGPPLELRAAAAVRDVVPGLLAVAPVREAALPVSAGGREADAVVVGTTAAYAEAVRLRLARGRFLSDVDLAERGRVAVIGATIEQRLFPFGSAAGEWLRIGDDWFRIVGVLEGRAAPRGRQTAIRTRDVNRAVVVPLAALDHGAGGPDGIDEIVLRVARPEAVTEAAAAALRVARRASSGAGLDVVVPREILRQREASQRVFDVVTGAVAALGLLVGGIGIMNIMLASVAERTREVGLRRAVGASRRDVATQFLVESTLLTTAGGVLGLALGVAGSSVIQHWAGWPTALSLPIVATALTMAAAVGVGFGSYPAWTAARLPPMAALRTE